MANDHPSDAPLNLANRTYGIPFGTYQPGGEAEPPAHEVLVGREGQRAYFIDLLLRMRPRGALLVTGRRGVGKTSFVHRTLSEYRDEVFERFLRGKVGRAFFWDILSVFAITLMAILALLMVAEVTELLTLSAPSPESPPAIVESASTSLPSSWKLDLSGTEPGGRSGQHRPPSSTGQTPGAPETGPPTRPRLLWLLIIPLALICAYPLLYARAVVGTIWAAGHVPRRRVADRLRSATRILRKHTRNNSRNGVTCAEDPDSSNRGDPPEACPSSESQAGGESSPQPKRKSDDSPVRGSSSSSPGVIAILLIGALAMAAWLLGPFGAPTVGLSRLLASLALLYLWVQANSFNWPDQTTWKSDLFHWFSWALYTIVALLLIYRPAVSDALFPASRLGSSVGLTVTGAHSGLEASVEVWLNFVVTGLFLSVGALFRWSHSSILLRSLPKKARLSTARRAPRWYLIASLTILGLAGLACWRHVLPGLGSLLVPLAVCILATLVYFLRLWTRLLGRDESATKPFSFRPRPLVLFGAKVIVAVVVSLQLLHPVVAVALSKLDIHPSTSTGSRNPSNGLRPAVPLAQVRRPLSRSREADQERQPIQPVGVFHGTTEERFWILTLFSIVLLVAFLEYEWVIRPFPGRRQDRAIDPRGPDSVDDQLPDELATSPSDPCEGWSREKYRELAELTIPWVICKAWLPSLLVSVNLGFERLDHRRVVHAMLSGLRNQYHRTFLSWRSPLANVGRFAGLLLLLMLTRMAGDHYFGVQRFDLKELDRVEREDSVQDETKNSGTLEVERTQATQLCAALTQRPLSLNHLICQLPKGNLLLGGLYFDLLGVQAGRPSAHETDHLLFYFLPFSEEPTRAPETKSSRPGDSETQKPTFPSGVHFRVYHLFLFFSFLFLGRYLLRKLPVLPYREVVAKIDEVMDNLSARTSITAKSGRWKPAHWLQGFFTDERVRQTEQEPVDPRTIEFLFLHILEDMRAGHYQLPGGRNQFIGLPAPEITFLFDELDKLGTRIIPPEAAAGGDQRFEILNAERRRSLELHKLLADMKSLLSSAPARFIFVGGRNLHDEWLADQTARQPLLTNIFDAEVYLPALITDQRSRRGGTLHEVVAQFLVLQADRARDLFDRATASRWQALFALPVEAPFAETFCQADLQTSRLRKFDLPGIDCLNVNDGKPCLGAESLIRDFVQFLTYRSMGNPKKLKELIGSFVRPVGRLFPPPEGDEPGNGSSLRRNSEPREAPTWSRGCQHVLRLGDLERFRIQLLADVYRHLTLTLGKRLVHRDDKLAISVFFLADFLFKFHGRAFSWSNLERVDELVHIHRAPDLREVLETMVLQWSERFLHPILNGMYDFRFRSDLAHEVRYISRQSPEEMAAFNFTLDESLTLKSLYESNISRLSPDAGQELQDLISDLGELHEFDQEFETARFHYRREISLLDDDLEKVTGWRGPLASETTVFQIMKGSRRGQETVRKYMTWGVARLRLMLQVGMTFELSRNLERAEVEYRDARTLAHALLVAMLNDESGDRLRTDPTRRDRSKGDDEHLHALKHLNILFQPAFAEAWAVEKLAGGVDTSITLVERELWDLRNRLPFVCDARISMSESVRVKHSNFALIAAELHNKAGDLYLFKGRQEVLAENIHEFDKQIAAPRETKGEAAPADPQSAEVPFRKGLEGYLLKAYYHYALALHELRRFVSHRRASSKTKLNIWDPDDQNLVLWETIERGRWTDFVFRSIGGALADLAEAMVGRISIYGLVRSLTPRATTGDGSARRTRGNHSVVCGMVTALTDRFKGFRTERTKEEKENGDPPEDRGRETRELVRWMVVALTDWLEGFPVGGAEEEKDGDTNGDQDPRKNEIWFPIGDESWRGAGTLDGWLGTWVGPPESGRPQDQEKSSPIIRFPETELHSDPNRLLVSLLLSVTGARFIERGGYLEDAARDLLTVSETISSYLWMVFAVRRVCELSSPTSDDDKLLELIESAWNRDAMGHDIWWLLTDLAVHALERADLLFQRSRRAEETRTAAQPERQLLGDKVPVSALTQACSLGLVACRWVGWLGRQTGGPPEVPDLTGLHRRLRRLIQRWTVEDDEYPMGDLSPATIARWYRDRLHDSLVRHSYPMINRLHGSKTLIDDRVLGEADTIDPEELFEQTKELLTERSRLDANLHFTPFHAGTTSGLVYLRLQLEPDKPETFGAKLEEIRRAGQRDLNASIEMYTMRRGFYEAISGLYYLYDDFNDRQIHFNHALQMAGAELVALLTRLVRQPDRVRPQLPDQDPGTVEGPESEDGSVDEGPAN